MVICGAVIAVSTSFGSEIAGQVVTAARLGKGHHSSSKSSGEHSSSSISSSLEKAEVSDADSMTGKCQNIPADNAAGTFQFVDKKCFKAMSSVPGCVGDSICRFCQTSIVPSGSRNAGWPTCPNQVCKEMKALGCKGEDSQSKTEVLWQLAREKATKHNDYVKGVSVGKCSTSPADRQLGRHQFSDVSCKTDLGPGCVGGESLCRFCQLSNGKQTADWVTCPDVVCKKWKIKGGGCEAPLELVPVPPKHPTGDFDVKKEEKMRAKEMKNFIHHLKLPAKVHGGGGGDASKGDGLHSHEPTLTGDIVVDLLQSKDRGAHGVTVKSQASPVGKASGGGKSSSGSKHEKNKGDDEDEDAGNRELGSPKQSSFKHKSSRGRRSLLSAA